MKGNPGHKLPAAAAAEPANAHAKAAHPHGIQPSRRRVAIAASAVLSLVAGLTGVRLLWPVTGEKPDTAAVGQRGTGEVPAKVASIAPAAGSPAAGQPGAAPSPGGPAHPAVDRLPTPSVTVDRGTPQSGTAPPLDSSRPLEPERPTGLPSPTALASSSPSYMPIPPLPAVDKGYVLPALPEPDPNKPNWNSPSSAKPGPAGSLPIPATLAPPTELVPAVAPGSATDDRRSAVAPPTGYAEVTQVGGLSLPKPALPLPPAVQMGGQVPLAPAASPTAPLAPSMLPAPSVVPVVPVAPSGPSPTPAPRIDFPSSTSSGIVPPLPTAAPLVPMAPAVVPVNPVERPSPPSVLPEPGPGAAPPLGDRSPVVPGIFPTIEKVPTSTRIEFTKPAGSEVKPASAPQTSFDVDLHEVRTGDSYEAVSREFFADARYAAALREFNGRRPLQAGGQVEVPPIHVLKSRYSQLIGSPPPATPASRSTPAPGGGDWAPSGSSSPGRSSSEGDPTFRPGAAKRFTVPPGGMTMQAVARLTLGDSSKWQDVYDLNPQYPSDNVPGGTELRLPAAAVVPK